MPYEVVTTNGSSICRINSFVNSNNYTFVFSDTEVLMNPQILHDLKRIASLMQGLKETQMAQLNQIIIAFDNLVKDIEKVYNGKEDS